MVMLYLWHWLACSYWLMGSLQQMAWDAPSEYDDGTFRNYWLPPREVRFSPVYGERYLYAFTWALTVTVGVGRDIIPSTLSELAFSMAATIAFGIFMFAVIIGGFTSTLLSLDERALERKNKLQSVKSYLRQRSVDAGLILRIQDYYRHVWATQELSESESFGGLHESLRLELRLVLRRSVVNKVASLRRINDMRCVVAVIDKLSQRLVLPEEVILKQGQRCKEMCIVGVYID